MGVRELFNGRLAFIITHHRLLPPPTRTLLPREHPTLPMTTDNKNDRTLHAPPNSR